MAKHLSNKEKARRKQTVYEIIEFEGLINRREIDSWLREEENIRMSIPDLICLLQRLINEGKIVCKEIPTKKPHIKAKYYHLPVDEK